MTCDRSVVFSTSKADSHDIPEILLKVVLSAITLAITQILFDHDQDAETDYLFNNRHILFYNDLQTIKVHHYLNPWVVSI